MASEPTLLEEFLTVSNRSLFCKGSPPTAYVMFHLLI